MESRLPVPTIICMLVSLLYFIQFSCCFDFESLGFDYPCMKIKKRANIDGLVLAIDKISRSLFTSTSSRMIKLLVVKHHLISLQILCHENLCHECIKY